MSNNLEKKVNSWYIRKSKEGNLEIKYFETLKQRQKYLLENDVVTKKYMNKQYLSKYVNSKRISDKFIGEE